MKTPSSIDRRALGFNMTPMIDVVFLLIIFFLLSSHLARQETQPKLPLPEAQSGVQDPADATPRVVVNVHADGTVMLLGKDVSAEQLQAQLAARRDRQGDELQLRIRCHRDVPYHYVKPVMLAATHAGIWNVQFAVVRDAPRS